jgi:hypothetical protein
MTLARSSMIESILRAFEKHWWVITYENICLKAFEWLLSAKMLGDDNMEFLPECETPNTPHQALSTVVLRRPNPPPELPSSHWLGPTHRHLENVVKLIFKHSSLIVINFSITEYSHVLCDISRTHRFKNRLKIVPWNF